jgi:hypothetical protein
MFDGSSNVIEATEQPTVAFPASQGVGGTLTFERAGTLAVDFEVEQPVQ